MDLEIVGVVVNTKYGNPREKQKELPDAVTKYLDCSKLMELHTHQKQPREKRVSLLRVIKPE